MENKKIKKVLWFSALIIKAVCLVWYILLLITSAMKYSDLEEISQKTGSEINPAYYDYLKTAIICNSIIVFLLIVGVVLFVISYKRKNAFSITALVLAFLNVGVCIYSGYDLTMYLLILDCVFVLAYVIFSIIVSAKENTMEKFVAKKHYECMESLRQLRSLLDENVVSEQEYAAEKKRILDSVLPKEE